MASKKSSSTKRDVVTLDDLAPRRDVRGGTAGRVFGADAVHFTQRKEEEMAGSKATKKTKDLPRKSSAKVNGGLSRIKGGITVNENLTIVRFAKQKPKVKKELPPKKNPKGGAVSGSKHTV